MCDLNPKRAVFKHAYNTDPNVNVSIYSSPTSFYHVKCSFCKAMIDRDIAITVSHRIWMHRECLQKLELQ